MQTDVFLFILLQRLALQYSSAKWPKIINCYLEFFQVQILLDVEKEDVNKPSKVGSYWEPPLVTAIDREHPYLVPLLIKHGADVNSKSTRGETPLMCAAYHNYTTPANMQNDQKPSSSQLVESMEQPGDTTFKAWPGSQTGERLDVMKILISRGAELDTKDNFGQTALCKAIRTLFVLQFLIISKFIQ